jgi:hypothetical protein
LGKKKKTVLSNLSIGELKERKCEDLCARSLKRFQSEEKKEFS